MWVPWYCTYTQAANKIAGQLSKRYKTNAVEQNSGDYASFALLLPLACLRVPPPTIRVALNFLALVSLRKRTSISANVLPFVSGSRHQLHTSPTTLVPAQKNPVLAPHAHAYGFNIRGVIRLVTIPDML